MATTDAGAPAAGVPEKALLFAQVQFQIVQGHGLSLESAETVCYISIGALGS